MEFNKNYEESKNKNLADCDGKGIVKDKEVFLKMCMPKDLFEVYQKNNKEMVEKVYNEKGKEMKVKLGDIKLD